MHGFAGDGYRGDTAAAAAVADFGAVAMMAARNCENAVAKNQVPITVLTRIRGDNFVTIDRPTGERQSSPVVWNR